MREAENRNRQSVAEAREMLDIAYRWLDDNMAGREWAVGDTFSLADCAAAPALFYADWTHPIDEAFENVHAYPKAREVLSRWDDHSQHYEVRESRSY